MPLPEPAFTPSPDVTILLSALLNKLERRSTRPVAPAGEERSPRSIKVALGEMDLPGYYSQVDPEPRQVANEQLEWLENAGMLRLAWQPGEKGHLLESAGLVYGCEAQLYALLRRIPTTSLRTRLESQLLGDRFRFAEQGWQYRAIRHVLEQIKDNKSPAPFTLNDPVFNEDLLLALIALATVEEETPFRVFSVRVFNNSKRFEDLKKAVVRLARFGHPAWKRLPGDELLRELNLVANPSYLLLSGAWTLVDAAGQVLSLGEFNPSVGIPSVQATHMERVNVHAGMVVCIENFTTFHAFAGSLASDVRRQNTALICLAGNPSPACRRLLKCLCDSLAGDIPLYAWADMDYGGFNILAQLRRDVSARFMPYHMGVDILDRYAQFTKPLTLSDRRNLERQTHRAELSDVYPVIHDMLKRGLKLEQEAITI
jgi:hypothetical protein